MCRVCGLGGVSRGEHGYGHVCRVCVLRPPVGGAVKLCEGLVPMWPPWALLLVACPGLSSHSLELDYIPGRVLQAHSCSGHGSPGSVAGGRKLASPAASADWPPLWGSRWSWVCFPEQQT